MKKLTQKQKLYCRQRAKGKCKKEAYTAAGFCPGATDKTRTEAACRLEKLPHIQREIERLTAAADAGAILDRRQRLVMLSEMALDDSRKDDSRQRAIDMLNRMNGDYTDRVLTEVRANINMSLDDKRRMIMDALKGNE